MDTRPSNHPTSETLQAYGLGKLDDATAEMVNQHLDSCSDCRRQVAEMAPDSFLARLRDAQAVTGTSTTLADTGIPPAQTADTQPETAVVDDATVDHSPPPHMSSTGHFAVTSAAQSDANGPALQSGTCIGYFGDYELQKVLGEGGMGIVYKARQLSLNRSVALKMIRAARFASGAEVRRFQNEAEAVAGLDHPHIVPIFEVGRFEDQHYFSMKLIAGDSLDKRLKDYVSDLRRAARLVVIAAGAVHHAHQRGILHRDLKPANILIEADGSPHVTDFGLAKRVEGDSELTQSGAIMGTPAYMAPEQASGKRGAVTTATDIYGLGAILYALLTGRAPFGGASVAETLEHVRERTPDSPHKLNARVPPDLEVICLKCLEKDPRRRYSSADALSEDLQHWLAGEPIAARPVAIVTRLVMWARRHPTAAALVGSSLVATIAMIATGFLIAYNGELKRANSVVEESRRKLQISYESQAAAREEAETAGRTAAEQRTIAVNALNEARRAIDLANSLLEGMEVAFEQLKGPSATTFFASDKSEFVEEMRNKQALADRVAYAVEETFQALRRDRALPQPIASARESRARLSRHSPTNAGEPNQSEALDRLQGHYDLILGRLLAIKVRCFEYNWACARMKKDPPKFTNPRSNSWSLVPDAAIQYSDKAYTAARDADRLLHRVVEEHPNTPWALQARRELHSPFGFRWVESYVEPKVREPRTAAKAMTKANQNDVNLIHFNEYRSCVGQWPVHLRERYEMQDTPMGSE